MADAAAAATNLHDKTAAAKKGGGATIPVTIVLLVLLVASVSAFLITSPPDGSKPRVEGGAGGGAEPVEHAVGRPGGGVPVGFNSRLDAFRAWAKLAWMKLHQRPHSDEPRYGSGGIAGSAAEAAKKSMEMGRETAAMATNKVKGVAAPSSDAEL